ncbi:MAG: prolyl aminopeptidase [Pseudomonadota bacterium]|nr:prolyl aminopeptidase [Pseudomonadota bacterium]
MLRDLYPAIEPYVTGTLAVSERHTLYFEQCGNPDGKPVVFLHGGPGAGCGPEHRRFFDPAHYRIVLFDQRGAGRSTPFADTAENTTWDLVADLERLRAHLKIARWQVFGGSWGSTLGLAYAQTHPERVSELVLRGVYLMRRFELEWMYQLGLSMIWPEYWQDFIAPIPAGERADMISAYHRQLNDPDRELRMRAARAWALWEGRTSYLRPNPEFAASFGSDAVSEAVARIECHYFVNGGFFEIDGQLLRDAHRLRGIPLVIVHGRYDLLCPPTNAWELQRAVPGSELIFVADAGHSAFEPGTRSALVAATDRFAG